VVLVRAQRQRPVQPDRSARVPAIGCDFLNQGDLLDRLRKLDMGQALDPIHAVVAERDPPVGDGDRQEPSAPVPREPPDFEDVGAVHAELELERE
jgi:hypothetical protein